MPSAGGKPLVGRSAAALAAVALPWLASAAVHFTVLAFLALSVASLRGAAARPAPSRGASLVSSIVESLSDDHADLAVASIAGSAQQTLEATDPAAPDVPAARSEPTPLPAGLAALLAQPAAIDPRGLFPARGNPLGVGLRGAGASGGGLPPGRGQAFRGLGRSGAARTGVFGVAGEGYKFVYVFDRSGSMSGHGGAPLAAAKSELLSSLDDLGVTHQFQLIFYNEEPQVFNPTGVPGRLVFANEANRRQARRFVDGVLADGGTQHEKALVLGLRMTPDVLFFLTDADEPRMTASQMARVARANRGTSLNTIEFGYGPQSEARNFLVRLAEENGGRHVYVDVSTLPGAR